MLPLEDIARFKDELKKLESALKNSTDSRIREVIEIRIEECRAKLRQL